MSAKTLYRASGLALMLGAVLGISSDVLSNVLFAGNGPQTSVAAQVLSLLGVIGNALFVLGLPGIAVRQSSRAGWLGFVGVVLTLLGGITITCLTFTFFAIVPALAQADPKLSANFFPAPIFVSSLLAGVLLAVGGTVLGIAIMRAKIWARWTGLALLLGAILSLGNTLPSGSILGAILSIVSFVLIAVAFGWIGYHLMTSGVIEAAAQPVASSSQATA